MYAISMYAISMYAIPMYAIPMYAIPMYAISMYAKIWKHCNWCKELEFTSPYKQLSGVIKNKK